MLWGNMLSTNFDLIVIRRCGGNNDGNSGSKIADSYDGISPLTEFLFQIDFPQEILQCQLPH